MRNLKWLAVGTALLLSIVMMGCGYAKKDIIEKQIADQKIELEQKIQLVQDTATQQTNEKTEKVLVTARSEIAKAKEEAIAAADEKDMVVMNQLNTKIEASDEAAKLMASEAAANALAEAKANAMAEDEKVKEAAKKAADKALSAAEEADRKAMQAAKEAELAKELPKSTTPMVFTVYFDLGQAKVKSEGVAELQKVADAIKSNPGAKVKVEGHTDNTPVIRAKYLNNWALSQARAESVKNYLVKDLGVSEDAISEVTGFAFYKPASPNDTGKGRQMNRRVDVTVMP